MGLAVYKIQFASGMPSVQVIASQYELFTGFPLTIKAFLNLHYLTPLGDVHKLLKQDADEVITLLNLKQNISFQYPHALEHQAARRDEIAGKSKAFVQITGLCIDLGPYEVEIVVEDNVLTIRALVGQFYGIQALLATLDKLGGIWIDAIDLERARTQWAKLKPWHRYRWYNRPTI